MQPLNREALSTRANTLQSSGGAATSSRVWVGGVHQSGHAVSALVYQYDVRLALYYAPNSTFSYPGSSLWNTQLIGEFGLLSEFLERRVGETASSCGAPR